MMKKIISFIFAGVLLIGLLAGCGADNSQENLSAETEQVELEVWVCYDRNVPGSYYVFLWDTLAEELGYSINIKNYSQQEIKDKLMMAMACNELPDIFFVPGGAYPEYLFQAGACIPVQDYLKTTDFKERYVLPYEDGNNYVIPCLPESYAVCYYDTHLMETIGLEIPRTWNDLIDLVNKVKLYNEENGTAYAAIELGMKDCWMGQLLYCVMANGIDSGAYDDLEEGTVDFSKEVFSETADDIRKLIELEAFPEDYLEIGEAEAVKNFINQKAVMMVHQSSLVYHLIQNKGDEGFQVDTFPGFDENSGEDQKVLVDMNHTYTPGLAISSRSEYQSEAAKLCLSFAERVNEINVEQYGYLNIMDRSYDTDSKTLQNIRVIQDLTGQAEESAPFWYAILPQDPGDTWGNVVKQFFACETDTDTFVEQSNEILNQN